MLRSLVAAPLVCGLALLASPPLSAQNPRPPSLASPMPPVQPLAELLTSEAAREVERMLASGSWTQAEEAARALLLDPPPEEGSGPAAVATDFALLALAQAGRGAETAALCRWHSAQALDSALLGAELSAYGTAGLLLEDHPLEDFDARPEGPPRRVGSTPNPPELAVLRPELIAQKKPAYTVSARKARVAGAVVLEVVINPAGEVSHARVLKGLPMGLTATAIDAVCDWRFKPATQNGAPVEVFFVLTVSYQVQDVPPARAATPKRPVP